MRKGIIFLLTLIFLGCNNDNKPANTSSGNNDQQCTCSDGTVVKAGDVVCIEEKRWKCVLDDEAKVYKLKPTAENCDEEDVKCDAAVALSTSIKSASLATNTTASAAKKVYYFIVPIKQKPNACWITGLTMLKRWKRNDNKITVEAIAKELGEPYKVLYETNAGLSHTLEKDYFKKAALTPIAPQNFTIAGWFELLERNGPLATDVLSFRDPVTNMLWTHQLILVGIETDAAFDPAKTKFTFIDPATGREEPPVSFAAFLKRYEAEPANQILHVQVAYVTK